MMKRYTDLNDFRSAKRVKKLHRDEAANRVSQRWDMLQEKRIRGALIRDGIGDILLGWGPLKKAAQVLNGQVPVSVLSGLAMAIASKQKSVWKKMLFGGVGVLLNNLMGDENLDARSLIDTIRGGIQRVASLFRKDQVDEVIVDVGADTTAPYSI